MGNTYLAMGKTEEALEAHRKLAELYPSLSTYLGITYAQTGYEEEAEMMLNGLLEDSEIQHHLKLIKLLN